MLHSGLARVPADRKVLFLGRCESPNLLQRGIESLRIAHEAATAKLINTAQNRLQLLSQSYYFPFPCFPPLQNRGVGLELEEMSFFPMKSTPSWRIFFEGLCGEVGLDLTKPGGQIDQQFPWGWTDGHIQVFLAGKGWEEEISELWRRFGGSSKASAAPGAPS